RIVQFSLARRRTSAEPTIPRWPATQTRLPPSSNISGIARDDIGAHHCEVGLHHLACQFAHACFMRPTELFARLGRVTEKHVDFRGAEIARVHLDETTPAPCIIALLVHPFAAPLDIDADIGKGPYDEVTHRGRYAGCE